MRTAFLELLERDSPLVYCPWCNYLHLPEAAIPKDNTTGRYCQSSKWQILVMEETPFPEAYHPLLLYGVRKYRLQGQDEAALSRALSIDTHTFDYGSYLRKKDWAYAANDSGIFVAKQERVTPYHYDHVFIRRYCAHCQATIKFGYLLSPDAPAVAVTACDGTSRITSGGREGQIHRCGWCKREIRIDIVRTDDPENQPAEVTITTWYHLGTGKSPEDVAVRQHNPVDGEHGQPSLIPAGEIAKLSTLFKDLA